MALPTFYFEANHSLVFQIEDINPAASGLLRQWNHPLWKLPNTVPEIALSVGTDANAYYNTNVSGLVSGFLREFTYHKNNFAAAGVDLTKYSFSIAGIGRQFGSRPYQPLLNHPRDVVVSGANVPWATSGIAYYTSPTGFKPFWAALRSVMTANNIPTFQVFTITSEDFGDDAGGLFPNNSPTGWVQHALSDPRSNLASHSIDGVQTFQSYWTSNTGWFDGTPIPTGMGPGGQYSPRNIKLRHKWEAARIMNSTYAKFKAFEEPMQEQFPGVPTVDYGFYQGGNRASPTPATYPGQPWCLVDRHAMAWSGPDFYNSPSVFYNDAFALDSSEPYWPSTTGWILTYPKPVGLPEPFASFTEFEYASYKWAIDRFLGFKNAFPNTPVCPWIQGLTYNTNKVLLLEVLKYCYNIGIDRFYVWEDNKLGSSAEHDYWYDVITQLNTWVESLQLRSPPSNRWSTVARFGGGYFKF